MSLTLTKKLNEILETDKFGVIYIKTSPIIFYKRFFGISNFFKTLKNGLYSINKVPNRIYFRGISGIYMSLEMDSNLEIIILYNPQITPLNSLQVKTRVRKLLVLGTEVKLGLINDYQNQIERISKIKTESQVFGDYYQKSNLEV
jgi:hypothetical protein